MLPVPLLPPTARRLLRQSMARGSFWPDQGRTMTAFQRTRTETRLLTRLTGETAVPRRRRDWVRDIHTLPLIFGRLRTYTTSLSTPQTAMAPPGRARKGGGGKKKKLLINKHFILSKKN